MLLLGKGVVFQFQMLVQMHEAPCYLKPHWRLFQKLRPNTPIVLPILFEVGSSWNSCILSFK